MSYLKKVFDRGFNQQWTDEIFTVKTRSRRTDPHTYTLVDYHGEDIVGSFYPLELEKITPLEDPFYRIEKIVMTRKNKGNIQYLVKWVGWPKKSNSFVGPKDIEDFKRNKK